MDRAGIELNGVRYRWPSQPVVVVCIDGGDPAYFERGVRDGVVPNVARFLETGFGAVADGDVPSFTCPNNMSITTGSPQSVHGISGNFYLDPATGEAVVMTGPELLRSRTIMAEFSRHGARVASVTAKDKLRKQLGKEMDLSGGSVNFSAECADQRAPEETGLEDALALTGLPKPHIYSADLSLFVLEAGIKLLIEWRPDILYLSLTDYVQHKYAPGEPEADRYYRAMDEKFGRLHDLGAVVALTADHGMNDKSNAAGAPNVIWLQDILDERFGKGETRVICPITDAFVGHHGALGGFVRVYRSGKTTTKQIIEAIGSIDGVEQVLDNLKTALARGSAPVNLESPEATSRSTSVSRCETDVHFPTQNRRKTSSRPKSSGAPVPIFVTRPATSSSRPCRNMFRTVTEALPRKQSSVP
jgi:phosphonoacetate hydrolase